MINSRIRSTIRLSALSMILVGSGLLAAPTATANNVPEFLDKYVESPELVGQGQYSQYFWKIYEARLYAGNGEYKAGKDFALQLEYQRNLSGKLIVEKSIELIAAQGISSESKLNEWKQLLEKVIPDVKQGDQLTGVKQQQTSHFYLNGEKLGEIAEQELSRYFFDIWLGEDTIAPALRQSLIGQSTPQT